MGWRRVLEGGQAEVGGGDARGSASRGVRLAMPANRRPARAPPATAARAARPGAQKKSSTASGRFSCGAIARLPQNAVERRSPTWARRCWRKRTTKQHMWFMSQALLAWWVCVRGPLLLLPPITNIHVKPCPTNASSNRRAMRCDVEIFFGPLETRLSDPRHPDGVAMDRRTYYSGP